MKKKLSAILICSVLLLPSAAIAEGTEAPTTTPATTGAETTQPNTKAPAPADSTTNSPTSTNVPASGTTSSTPAPSTGGASGPSGGGTSSFKNVKTKMTNFHHHWKGNNVQSLLKKEYKN